MNEPAPSFQRPFDAGLAALGTDPIPARAYYDEDWHELELDAIIRRTWINVGHVCELPEPGSFIVRDLEFARASLIIARGKDGTIRDQSLSLGSGVTVTVNMQIWRNGRLRQLQSATKTAGLVALCHRCPEVEQPERSAMS